MKAICSLALASVLISGCASISVQRDYDDTVDFSALETYAWKHKSQPKTGEPRVDNDLLDKRIRSAVETTLGDKGFLLAECEKADFLVAYFIEYKQRIGGNSWSFGIGSGWYDGFGGIGYNTSISDYDEGYLTIDVIERKSAKTIWRGVGKRATYEAEEPEKAKKIISRSVDKILSRFPPSP